MHMIFFSKGQTISKGPFGVLKFSQKTKKEFVVVAKNKFVCSFIRSFVPILGEYEDTKSPFEII